MTTKRLLRLERFGRLTTGALAVLGIAALAGCGADEGAGANAGAIDEGVDESAISRSCARGSTLRGIDVSYYQDDVDWDAVKAAGISFAFIRVSDGLANVDSKFDRNWAEAKRVGIRRGVYQYFRPNLDATAQADLLLRKMGQLQPGDLPPVIDVEAAGGLGPSGVAAKVQTWIQRVQAATGITPIIYTGPYFWRDSVGSPSFSANHPLWIAHYTTACPLVPEPWARWTFHQYSESGRVAGIGTPCDVNYFDGTEADLAALAYRGNGGGGGGTGTPPPSTTCQAIGANGGTLEENDACVTLAGNPSYLRTVSGGHGGSYVWTGATASSQTENSATWTLRFAAAGSYKLEAWVENGTSRQAKYAIAYAGGERQVTVNQSLASGFVDLGTYYFESGTRYSVRLVDNTGEAGSLGRRIVFDALRATPAGTTTPPSDPNTCQPAGSSGRTIEEDDACVELGGPSQYLRSESGGSGGSHVWTGATAAASAENFARWSLATTAAGTYRVEAYVGGDTAGTREARYRITHATGSDDVYVDQSTARGFIELGTFELRPGGAYEVRLDDNTGESSSLDRQVIFDAVRLTPVTTRACPTIALASGVTAVNVRARPNTTREAIGQISSGQLVDRLATVSGAVIEGNTTWYRVRTGANVGYVSARYAVCR